MGPIVTLLSDFGTTDSYVAEMKAAILAFVRNAMLVDVTHEVPPQDVDRARLLLERYWQRFPPGTVHLVVVDPGVGTARRALAVECGHARLVGPDNGVLSPALSHREARAVELLPSARASATFHGRDILAPAAAALALGTPLAQLGRPVASPRLVTTPVPTPRPGGAMDGIVLTFDRFGNAVTNLTAGDDTGERTVEVASRVVPLRRTYADVAPGEPLALVGSSGLVEIAVRDGNAAHRLGLEQGMPVRLR
jgi:S-adenosyl-L-methionine hydrolase (adenosine-forming)